MSRTCSAKPAPASAWKWNARSTSLGRPMGLVASREPEPRPPDRLARRLVELRPLCPAALWAMLETFPTRDPQGDVQCPDPALTLSGDPATARGARSRTRSRGDRQSSFRLSLLSWS
jgi:hypothetical protein